MPIYALEDNQLKNGMTRKCVVRVEKSRDNSEPRSVIHLLNIVDIIIMLAVLLATREKKGHILTYQLIKP